jgi:hypothetical protein
MAGIVLGALTVYYILKYNPAKAKQIICSSDEYLKYMPIDKTQVVLFLLYWISPKQKWGELEGENRTVLGFPTPPRRTTAEVGHKPPRLNGRCPKRRKVRGVKAQWHCRNCNNILNHTFEIDHIISLNNGGSNHVDNLALCPACHRERPLWKIWRARYNFMDNMV